MRLFLLAGLVVFITINALPQELREKFSAKDLINLEMPANAVFSQNGDKAAFTIKKADFTLSKWNTQVYLMDIASGKYERFSPFEAGSTHPEFSTNQKWIAFLSVGGKRNSTDTAKASESTQLWIKDLKGGEPEKLTGFSKDVEDFRWSDDMKLVACLTEEENPDKEKAENEAQKLKIDGRVFPEIKTNKVISFFDFNKRKVINSFVLDPGVEKISFNRNGDKIIYQTNYTGEFNDEQKFDIYIIDTSGKKTQITSAEGPETSPLFSPDDMHIAFITQTVPDIEFAKTELCITDINGKSLKNLTKDFRFSIESFIWETGSTILAVVQEDVYTPLYRININTNEIERVSYVSRVVSDLSVIRNNVICYRAENSKTLPELYINGEKKTDFTSAFMKLKPGSQSIFRYKSGDKKFDLSGILFYPENFDRAKKYPLIVTLHGGPYHNFKNTLNQGAHIRLLTQEGYLVFAPNPRGSTGDSDEFGQANRYDLGGGDYRDVMDGVDSILTVSNGTIDGSRMGVTGGSYGGYLTNWIISQNNRFKAAVSMFGIFSFITDWSNSFQPSFENMFLGYNYWERPVDTTNLYINRSPAFYASKIKTPTLILHGREDVYTDVSNSREMYQALRALNVPVQFVIYPREGHGIKGEPNHYADVLDRIIKWFNTYIK